jgi:hypothetical protein
MRAHSGSFRRPPTTSTCSQTPIRRCVVPWRSRWEVFTASIRTRCVARCVTAFYSCCPLATSFRKTACHQDFVGGRRGLWSRPCTRGKWTDACYRPMCNNLLEVASRRSSSVNTGSTRCSALMNVMQYDRLRPHATTQ